MKLYFLLPLLFITNFSIYAQDTTKIKKSDSEECGFSGGGVLFDEDYLMDWFIKDVNKDRDYTGGFALTFSGKFIESGRINILQKGVDYLFGLKKIHDERKPHNNHSLKLSQTVFSPQGKNLNITYPIYDDRPYASIATFSTSTTSIDSGKTKALTTEFAIGAFGWNWGEVSQAYIHSLKRECDTCRPYDPVGWDNQISNGGEFVFQYNVSSKNLLCTGLFAYGRQVSKFKLFDVFVSRDLYLGHYTAVGASITGRVGVIRSNWGLFSSSPFGADAEALGKLNQGKRNFELYLFSTLRPKLIAYNAALQGLTQTSVHVFNSSQINHFAVQFEGGIGLTCFHVMSVNLVYAHRTPEFKGPKGLSHDWLGIYLVFHSPFY